MPGTTISDRGRVLTIPNAPLEAEGGYLCTVNGKAGVADKTISVVMESKNFIHVYYTMNNPLLLVNFSLIDSFCSFIPFTVYMP